MPYITREDGERFIIPSYRDTLSAKKASLLKKEIILLSTNYGEYITLQKKAASSYEIAFSPETGYLLGECVWHHFKRPYDMIYCEAIPNTSEVILVIVKAGSVYLDGSFPIDSIPEELVVFKTQQNNFSIYIYGDVPISQTPEAGKFSFDASSVRSFEILDKPVFPTLPTVKAFQLQLVEVVLRANGIGVLPTKQIIMALVALGFVYMGYSYVTSHKKELPTTFVTQANPYQGYIDELTSPDPSQEIRSIVHVISLLYTIPGWAPTGVEYITGFPAKLHVSLISTGARSPILFDWANRYNAQVDITPAGYFTTLVVVSAKRSPPSTISPLQEVIATMLDRMSYIMPDSNPTLTPTIDRKSFLEASFTINITSASLFTLDMLGRYLQGLPLVLSKFSIKMDQGGTLSGTITFKAVGS